MDKFTSQVQVEETADFQAWLDAQEVADIRAMEAQAAKALRRARRMATVSVGILRKESEKSSI